MNFNRDEKINGNSLFNSENIMKGIEAFRPELCSIEKEKLEIFERDEVAMGCCEGCWSGCIGTCRYNSH